MSALSESVVPGELPAGLRPGGRYAEWTRRAPRYLVADVDGTLLAETHEPSHEVRRAAALCAPAGLRLGLATGRMPGAVAALIELLEAPGPHVLHNGAEVWADGQVLHAWPLPSQASSLLAELCAAHSLYAEFYAGDTYWVTDRRAESHRHWGLLRSAPAGVVADLDIASVDVLKATVILFAGDDPEPVLAALRAAGLTCGAAHAPALPEATFLNVTHPDAHKGRALGAAAQALGLDLAEVAAVGDGLNDLSMLEVAGTAIAMGQAPLEVQRAAHLIVPELADDGVAHALRAAAQWCAQA